MEGLFDGSGTQERELPTTVENSRGVALSSSLGKVHAKWLSSELTRLFEAGAFESQAAFNALRAASLWFHKDVLFLPILINFF